MKIARFVDNGTARTGVVVDDHVHEIDWEIRDLLVLAARGDEPELRPTGVVVPVGEADLQAPIVPGARLFCVGINYLEHQRESADVFVADVPKDPIIFLKDVSAMTGPHSVLHLPDDVSQQFDWEAELGVVIGSPVRSASHDEALDAIAGYTVVNDITARDLQTKHMQWTLGKNNFAATPIGPWIVTKSETGARPEFDVSLRVNGDVKQSGNTRDMIFDIAQLICTVSAVTPLAPGDVLITGTPSGVGFKRTPPEFLHEGDVVETRIEGIGTIVNSVQTRSQRPALV